VAGDGTGTPVAFTLDGTAWSGPQPLTGSYGFQQPSCASPSFCVAGDYEGGVLTFNGSSWSRVQIERGGCFCLGSYSNFVVSCPSASFCIAIDGGTAWFYPASAAPQSYPATLKVSPVAARAGASLRVLGSVGRFDGRLACRPRERVALSSNAFALSSRAGRTVYGKVARDGSFSARARIPARTHAGRYTVSGHCGSHLSLGATATLRILAP
jgi:hypothetical protein